MFWGVRIRFLQGLNSLGVYSVGIMDLTVKTSALDFLGSRAQSVEISCLQGVACVVWGVG